MHHCLLIGLVWTALAAASPTPLLAAEAHATQTVEHAAKGVENDIFKGAIDLSLWTIVVFLLLLAVLHEYAWGPILGGLKQREEGIARDKAEAEHARKSAADAKAEAEAERARARADASQTIAKALQDAQATTAEELARGKAEVQAERDRLRHEMEVAREQALQEIWGQGVQLATLISSKAVGKQLSYEDHRSLLNEALAEFRAAGQSRVEDLESAKA